MFGDLFEVVGVLWCLVEVIDMFDEIVNELILMDMKKWRLL